MQSFCFFGPPKEVGVRGLVPENNKNTKTEFCKFIICAEFVLQIFEIKNIILTNFLFFI